MFRNRSLGFRLVAVGGLVVLGMLLVWGGSIGVLAWSLQSRVTRLSQMAGDPKQLDIAVVAQEVHGAREEFTLLHEVLAPALWVASRFEGDLSAAAPLMDAGLESIIAGDESLRALAPALGELPPGSLSLWSVPKIMDALVVARPELDRAYVHLNRAADQLKEIDGPLSPQVAKVVSQATKAVELARLGMGGARVAPELLGRDGSRTYLVLVQNSDELRATGGFITNVGRVEIKHGMVISQTFEDSYAVDDFTKYYPDPPQPLLDYMNSEQWVFRDSNWSPDFPTAAKDAVRLYQVSRPEQIDGVIALNQMAVQMLVAGLEPLAVEGVAEPLTSENVSQVLREAWQAGLGKAVQAQNTEGWIATRKSFVGATMRAALQKLFSGEVNWTRLAQGALGALEQRQLMMYTSGPEAGRLREMGWDGAVRADAGDYVMVVDSNIGYSKSNPLVAEKIEYEVALRSDNTAGATVILSYAHQGTQGEVVCDPNVPYDANLTYEKLIHRCYLDYVRVLVPRGSRLRKADAHPVPGKYLWSRKDTDGIAQSLPDESGRSGFGQFFVVEYGERLKTSFEYDLPVVVNRIGSQSRYTLTLQKQSGTNALPVHVKVTLPERAQIDSVDPVPVSRQGALEFDLKLDTDKQIRVMYTLAP